MLGLLIAVAGVARLGPQRRAATRRRPRLARRRVDLRQTLYDHLQSLELGFFDRQQTGQLMSRATVDLQAVRFFLGYGLDLHPAGGADDRARRGRDDRHRTRAWPCIALRPVPFVICDRLALRAAAHRPAIQEVQQRIAELTADAEENISGVRVVKAFAQRVAPARRASAQRSTRVFDQSMVVDAARRPSTTRSSASCPSSGSRVLLHRRRPPVDPRPRSRSASSSRSTATCHAHRRRCGRSASARSGPARDRLGRADVPVLDRAPRLVAPPDAPPLPPATVDVRAARRHPPLRAARP